MKKAMISFALTSSVICSSAFAAQMPDPFSDPHAAVQARQGVERLMATMLMDIGALGTGQKPWNGVTMVNRVEALEALSFMQTDLYMVEGSHENSNTVNDAAERKQEFQKYSRDLQIATYSVRMSSHSHDSATAMKAMVEVMQSCNACHQTFMKPGSRIIFPIPDVSAVASH